MLEPGKNFCCQGCKQVYLLLNENNLCTYYNLDNSPGLKSKGKFTGQRFAYLDDEQIIQKLIQFSSATQTNVTFSLPQIHCSSCVYLLENLHTINPAIITSRSDFQRKEIFIRFDPTAMSLRKVVELLAFIGYEPEINLNTVSENPIVDASKKSASTFNRMQIYRIGVAGFCFANIMMLSFPEYLSSGDVEAGLKHTFTWLSLFLSLPLLFFCANDIFLSAWTGLKQKYINIDVPIALAIIVTFSRSYYEIISATGAGYLDSGSGIVFFMLIGRWFQNKTYDAISFDRNYRSYFPLGVTVIQNNAEQNIPVTKLKKGDRILIRNEEMIPADAILLKGDASIDYSFVSGENAPVAKKSGELLYAGGKQIGSGIELQVVNNVSQNYLTQLWNKDVFAIQKNKTKSFIHPWSRYFTLCLFAIALGAVAYWFITDTSKILPALTAVLIVACPCSLLLSATFTYGNMLRIFGKHKLYLKNASVIETLAAIDTIVFDKTGTITETNNAVVEYFGKSLTVAELCAVANISSQSAHPVSKIIAAHVDQASAPSVTINNFVEHTGKGLSAMVQNTNIKIGSFDFVHAVAEQHNSLSKGTEVHVQFGNEIKGHFSIRNQYRPGIEHAVQSLKLKGYGLHVLSGDNNTEEQNLLKIFGKNTPLQFTQTPEQKFNYIKKLQSSNKKVLMIGDGLNDAGALMLADAGIAVNDNNARFTPACDAILDATQLRSISNLLGYAKAGKQIVTASFILSILYNIVGLSYAVSAHLSPMVAAILMPASSISIVLFVTLATNIVSKNKRFNN